jgi:cell division protease FtsH
MAYGGRSDQVFLGQQIAQRREYSETTAREIDEEIKDILSQAYQRAQDTLKEHREHLDKLVDALVAKEEIIGEAVVALVEGDPSELFGEDGQPKEENEEKAKGTA